MFHLCSYRVVERFDPRTAGQTPALAGPGWTSGEAVRRGGIFGERAIGELVRAILDRLDEDGPGPSRRD
jgi:hypothetical protein